MSLTNKLRKYWRTRKPVDEEFHKALLELLIISDLEEIIEKRNIDMLYELLVNYYSTWNEVDVINEIVNQKFAESDRNLNDFLATNLFMKLFGREEKYYSKLLKEKLKEEKEDVESLTDKLARIEKPSQRLKDYLLELLYLDDLAAITDNKNYLYLRDILLSPDWIPYHRADVINEVLKRELALRLNGGPEDLDYLRPHFEAYQITLERFLAELKQLIEEEA